MVDFVTTFIVPYVVLITLGISVFNAWMLIIIAKKFFIKNTHPNDAKSVTRKSHETTEAANQDEQSPPTEEKREKKPSKDVNEAPNLFIIA